MQVQGPLRQRCGLVHAIFSVQLLFATNPSDTVPTNSAASATVWPESTFYTLVVDSVSFDSTTSTLVDGKLVGQLQSKGDR